MNHSHRETLYLPDGRVLEHVTYPIAEFPARLYCKYCYTTHSDWYLMAKEDYGGHVVALCGKCEYTSMVMLIDNVEESELAMRALREEPEWGPHSNG